MSVIAKIVIKGCSGYGPYEEAYEDKLTMTATSIAYEYKPLCVSEENPVRKWSYKSTSHQFGMLFSRIAGFMPSVLEPKIEAHCCDVGMIDFTVTYEDKSKKRKTYWCTGDEFREVFMLIKKLVPSVERTPEVIMVSDDYDDLEDNPND